MLFHFSVLLWSLIFGVGLFAVARSTFTLEWTWYLYSIGPLLLISLIAARRITRHSADAFIPMLLSLSAPTLISLIDAPTSKHIFVVATTIMYYVAYLGIYRVRHAPQDRTAQAMIDAAAVAGLFFFYSSVYGFYLNFDVPLWGLLSLFIIGTALACVETFVWVGRKERRRIVSISVAIGLIMGELAWVMSFWPFGYLTTGTVATLLVFLFRDITADSLRDELSLKRAAARIAVVLILVGLLLVSTPWRILSS